MLIVYLGVWSILGYGSFMGYVLIRIGSIKGAVYFGL